MCALGCVCVPSAPGEASLDIGRTEEPETDHCVRVLMFASVRAFICVRACVRSSLTTFSAQVKQALASSQGNAIIAGSRLMADLDG